MSTQSLVAQYGRFLRSNEKMTKKLYKLLCFAALYIIATMTITLKAQAIQSSFSVNALFYHYYFFEGNYPPYTLSAPYGFDFFETIDAGIYVRYADNEYVCVCAMNAIGKTESITEDFLISTSEIENRIEEIAIRDSFRVISPSLADSIFVFYNRLNPQPDRRLKHEAKKALKRIIKASLYSKTENRINAIICVQPYCILLYQIKPEHYPYCKNNVKICLLPTPQRDNKWRCRFERPILKDIE